MAKVCAHSEAKTHFTQASQGTTCHQPIQPHSRFQWRYFKIFTYYLAKELFKLLNKYQTEGKKEKKERLKKEAEVHVAEQKKEEKKKPIMVKYGLNHVTSLIENNKAELVAIAHNVEPIELVLHLPTLCRKKGIPFCFVKGIIREE